MRLHVFSYYLLVVAVVSEQNILQQGPTLSKATLRFVPTTVPPQQTLKAHVSADSEQLFRVRSGGTSKR